VGACWAPFVVVGLAPMFIALHASTENAPAGVSLLASLIGLPLALLGLTAPFGTTILGWIAVSQIRRSAGELYGMWLAVFDCLLFPLLTLDALIWFICTLCLYRLDVQSPIGPGSPSFVAYTLPVLVIAIAISLLADWLVIRRVWRAVNKGSAGVPPAERARMNPTIKIIAIVCGVLVLGAGITVVSVHQSSNNKLHAASMTSADFHWRVFEADAVLVDRLIPAGQRQHGVQSTAKAYLKYSGGGGSRLVDNGTNSFKVTISRGLEIDSWVAQISPETLVALLDGIGSKTNILADGTQTVSGVWWPSGIPTIWSYIQRNGVFYRGGNGGINLAIRQLDGQDNIRIEGEIQHKTDSNEIVGMTSRFLYEGKTPQNDALAFLVPFFRQDGSEHYLVVVYEVSPRGNSPRTAAPELDFDSFVQRVRKELSRASVRFDKLHISAVNDDSFIVSFSGLEAHGVMNGKDAWIPMVGSVGELEARRGRFGGNWEFKGFNQLGVARFTIANLDLDKLLETNLAEAMPAASAAAQNLSFGPVIERVVADSKAQFENEAERTNAPMMIDFDSGSLLAGSSAMWAADTGSQKTWMQTNGVDAMGVIPQVNGLVGLDMKAVRVLSSMWSNVSAAAIAEVVKSKSSKDTTLLSADELLPSTWIFQTREGGMGILQITGFTENPRGVKVRYKLVQNGNESKIHSDISPAMLAETPKLQFLAWQDEWETNQPVAARHPDGSPVTDANELKWLRNVNAGGMSTTFESNPRFLKLWFSHPTFQRTHFSEVSLLDDAGRALKRGADGSSSCSLVDASEKNGQLGWRCWTGSPGEGTNFPAHLTVQLRYTSGPLERTQEVKSDFNGTMSLEGKSILNGIGQNAKGHAFVAIAVNAKNMQSRVFDAVAVAKDGREISHFGSGRGGSAGSGVDVGKFEFDVPLADVAKFIIGTRAIRTNEWTNVMLPTN